MNSGMWSGNEVMFEVRGSDRWLLVATMLLASLGTLMVYSSTSVVTPAEAERHVSEFHYLRKHAMTVLVGFGALWLALRVRPRHLRAAAVPLLVLSFVLLSLVFVPGVGVSAGGAARWVRLWPSTFQPSELVKLAMVIFLARYISNDGFLKNRFRSVAAPVAVMAVFQIIYLKQPDFGSTVTLGVLTLGMLYLAGVRLRYLFIVLSLSAPAVLQLVREPYRLKRVVAFLDPWKDPLGSGFQLVQSFIAFGRGGLTGVGLGQSRQKLDFLPEVHTDFIFSLVGEELGFAVAALVVVLFAVVFWRGVRIAEGAADPFSRYLAYGLSMMIALQSLVNFCVVTGLLPTKGLPLPFLSYGGSSLLINLAAVGILLNLSRPQRLPETDRDDLAELIRKKKARRAVYGVMR